MIETANNLITSMHIAPRFTPIYPENIFDIIQWCKDYPQFNKFPVTPERRFGIGLYQIHQCIDWKDNGVNKYESLAAAVLHFIQTGLALDLDIILNIPTTEVELKDFPIYRLYNECYELLRLISSAQQQIYYGVSKTDRAKRRYDKLKLGISLSKISFTLICSIPIEFRSECFEKATTIICKELK